LGSELIAVDSDQMPLAMSFLLGPLLVGAGGLIAALAIQGWRGQLRRDRGAGIRTPTTLASDEAWEIAHRAAGPWMFVGSLGSIVPGIVVLFRPTNEVGTFTILAGLGVMVAFVVVSGAIGTTAASHSQAASHR
jgi:hypothetical protein